MGNPATWGRVWRLAALIVIAAGGLFCDNADDDDRSTESMSFTARSPADLDQAGPNEDVVIFINTYLDAWEEDAVEVVRSGLTEPTGVDVRVEPLSDDSGTELVVEAPPGGYARGFDYTATLYASRIETRPGYPSPERATYAFTFTVPAGAPTDPPVLGDPTEVPISDGYAVWTDVAADGNGTGLVLMGYEELSSTSSDFWQHVYAAKISDCSLGTPTQLLFDAGDRGRPAVAMSQDGTGIAAGPLADGASHGIWVRHYDPATDWSESTSPPLPSFPEAVKAVHVAMDQDGNGIAAYLAPPAGPGTFWHVEHTTYAQASDTWSAPAALPTDRDLAELQLAMNPTGVAVLATIDDAGSRIRAHCVAGGDVTVTPVAGYEASQLQLDVDEDGEAFLVWRETTTDGTASRIRTARATNCGAPTVEYLDDGSFVVNGFPSLHTLSRGRAASAHWGTETVGVYHLRVRQYEAATGWTAGPTTVFTSSTPPTGTAVAFSPSGQLTVLGYSSAVGEISTETAPGSFTAALDVTSVPNPISLQSVEQVEPLYLADEKLIVVFVTDIGGLRDAMVTPCE